jgi:hypothetical protein
VQALIRQGARAGVRTVLLVGDDTFDPRDFSGLGQESYIPSLMGWDGQYGRVPSENRYADVDGDGSPGRGHRPPARADLGRGGRDGRTRSPARPTSFATPDGATSSWSTTRARAIRTSPGEASKVAALLGAGAETSWGGRCPGSGSGAHRPRGGPGRGSPGHALLRPRRRGLLGRRASVRRGQAASLGNAGHETLLFAWTCVSQNYLFGLGPSVGEAMLLAPGRRRPGHGGPDRHHRRQGPGRPLRAALSPPAARPVLGEALRRAKAETLRLDPDGRGVVEGWSLLGDPALTLPVEGARR